MAAGDVIIFGPSSVADTAFLDLQPGAGVEIVVHNICYEGAMELYFSNGSTNVKADEDTTAGSRLGLFLHCTNSNYYRIKNVSGGAVNMGADGIVTK